MLFGNSLQAYITAALVLGGTFLVVTLARRVVGRRVRSAIDSGRIHAAATLVEDLERSMRALTYVLAVSVALGSLTFGQRADHLLSGALLAATAFLCISVGYNALRVGLDVSLRRKGTTLDEHKSRALLPVVKVAAWVIAATFLLDNFGFKIGTILAGLGVAGVAVGFAAQAVLGDLFSYFAILFDRPFTIGDLVILDSITGTIEYIGLKTTRIRGLDGEQIILPNSDLTSSRLRNFRRMTRRRVLLPFGVVYQTPAATLERIPQVVRQVVESVPLATFDRAHFKRFGDSSLDFEAVYHVEDPDYATFMDVQQAVNLGLVRALAELGVDFAYPTRTLFIERPGAQPPQEDDGA